jgi:hypothetical protein
MPSTNILAPNPTQNSHCRLHRFPLQPQKARLEWGTLGRFVCTGDDSL